MSWWAAEIIVCVTFVSLLQFDRIKMAWSNDSQCDTTDLQAMGEPFFFLFFFLLIQQLFIRWICIMPRHEAQRTYTQEDRSSRGPQKQQHE